MSRATRAPSVGREVRSAPLNTANSAQHDPGWRVVAGANLPPHLAINPSRHQASDHRRAEEEVVEAETGVALPSIPLVVPKRVDRVRGMKRPDRVGPALAQEAPEGSPTLRLQQRIVLPGPGRIDVEIITVTPQGPISLSPGIGRRPLTLPGAWAGDRAAPCSGPSRPSAAAAGC
jgi:hypothetical protein